jgi:DNA replication protein DnaC
MPTPTSQTSETSACRSCGGVVPVFTLFGARLVLPYCEDCAERERIAEDRLEREQAERDALKRAGVTERLAAQTLDTSPVSADAVEACRAWLAAYREGERRSLWIYGPVGGGKTGLAWGLVRELALAAVARFYAADEERRGASPGTPALFVNWRDLLADLRSEMRLSGDGYGSALYARAQRVPVLALDDLGAERPTPWALEALATLVQARYDSQKPTVVTANYGARDLASRLDAGDQGGVEGRRIVSRLIEDAVSIHLEGPNLRRSTV